MREKAERHTIWEEARAKREAAAAEKAKKHAATGEEAKEEDSDDAKSFAKSGVHSDARVEEEESEIEDDCTGDGGGFDFYFASLEGDLLLDAEAHGGIARFANSSCWPNCTMQRWTVMGESRLALVTVHPVMAGEELTYNYHSHENNLEETQVRNKQKCLCGQSNCCGAVGGSSDTTQHDQCLKRIEFLLETLRKRAADDPAAAPINEETAAAAAAAAAAATATRLQLDDITAVVAEAARLGITTATALSAEEEVDEFKRWHEERKQRKLRRATLEQQLNAQKKSSKVSDETSDDKSQSSSGAEAAATTAVEATTAVATEGSAAAEKSVVAPADVIPEMQHIPIRRCVACLA